MARIDSRGSNVAAAPGRGRGAGRAARGRRRCAPGMTLHAGEAPAGRRRGRRQGGRARSPRRPGACELGAWVALGYLHRNVEAPGPGPGALGRRRRRLAPGPGRAAAARRRRRAPSRADGVAAPVPARSSRGGRRTAVLLAAGVGLRAGGGGDHAVHLAGRHPDGAPDRRAGGARRRPLALACPAARGRSAGPGPHPYRAWVVAARRRRRVGAGRVRRPGQPGRPPDPELHGRRASTATTC